MEKNNWSVLGGSRDFLVADLSLSEGDGFMGGGVALEDRKARRKGKGRNVSFATFNLAQRPTNNGGELTRWYMSEALVWWKNMSSQRNGRRNRKGQGEERVMVRGESAKTQS